MPVRALMIYPKFPMTFWSSEKAIELVGRKVVMPPLGLITVAALLPPSWEITLVDRHIRPVTDAEWAWADVVMLSAMMAQRQDFFDQVREAKRRGKCVVVGGPYPTALPKEAEEAGADYLVLDEGELTVPMFVEAMAQRSLTGTSLQAPVVFRAHGERPDVTKTPVPRFDLLDLDAYDTMSVQFSRGCPFLCEFCDIITLYGRRPRTKTPKQMLVEFDRLRELGWRGAVFMVDDNFIGHKRDVKHLLEQIKPWQDAHGHPFSFTTEASIDLANEPDLLDLMTQCGFYSVFVGIETPDVSSLALTRKHQNTRRPLTESVDRITRSGIRVMAGFIIGFDGEQAGAGQRIVDFVEETGISTAAVTLLQALPDTGLWKRLELEGRLLDASGDITVATLMNFTPTRPLEEIVAECDETVWALYDPMRYLDRTYRYFQILGTPASKPSPQRPGRRELVALAIVCWRQGARRATRWKFWHHLAGILWHRPANAGYCLAVCAHYEHFTVYRQMVRTQLQGQLSRLAAS